MTIRSRWDSVLRINIIDSPACAIALGQGSPAAVSLASPRPFGFCKIFALLRAAKFLSKGWPGFPFASSFVPMQLALRYVRGTTKTRVMYEAINPACSKAILARMLANDLKRHYQYLFKQIGLQTEPNKVLMYENLARFCVYHAKRRFPTLDLIGP